jgi:hypothetical protein
MDVGNHSRRSLYQVLRAEKFIGTTRTGDSSPAGGSRQMLRRIAASFTRTATVPLAALTVP